jgi:hypothetical protein
MALRSGELPIDRVSNWLYNQQMVKAIIWLACCAMIQANGFGVATVKPTAPPSRFPVYVGARIRATVVQPGYVPR